MIRLRKVHQDLFDYYRLRLHCARAMMIVCCFVLTLMYVDCGGSTSTPTQSLSITPASLPDAFVDFPYRQTIQVFGGTPPYTWAVSSGALPNGILLAPGGSTSAVISGTPATAQSTLPVAITVSDAKGHTTAASFKLTVLSTQNAQLQAASGQIAANTIEIRGLSAGPFNPSYWQKNTLNWVADVRLPFLLAQTTGQWRNIYSPWALEEPSDWRIFFGGWDGSNTPNDRVYSVNTTDFISFTNRRLVIDHGALIHVNNENVQRLTDGSLHMIATGGMAPGMAPGPFQFNKPVYFFSPDGITWNGSLAPYQAQLSDIISIPNYSLFASGNFNGANVLFYDNNQFTLFFQNWNDQSVLGTMDRATTTTPPTFSLQGLALATSSVVQDIKKIQVNGNNWYAMGMQTIFSQLSYSLSNDGINFGPEQIMFGPAYSPDDALFVTMCFVTHGNALLGALYGGTDRPANPNSIYARWLQKKVVLADSSGNQIPVQGSYGPDRQQFAISSGSLQGTIWVYAEDGLTPVATGQVQLAEGQSYQLILH